MSAYTPDQPWVAMDISEAEYRVLYPESTGGGGNLTKMFPNVSFPWKSQYGITEAEYAVKYPKDYAELQRAYGSGKAPVTSTEGVNVLQPGTETDTFIDKMLADPNFKGDKTLLKSLKTPETPEWEMPELKFENPFLNWKMPEWVMPQMPAYPTVPGKLDASKALKKAPVKTPQNKRLRLLSTKKDKESLGSTTSGKVGKRRLLGAG